MPGKGRSVSFWFCQLQNRGFWYKIGKLCLLYISTIERYFPACIYISETSPSWEQCMSGMQASAPLVLEVIATCHRSCRPSGFWSSLFLVRDLQTNFLSGCTASQGQLVPSGITVPVQECVRWCQSSREGVLLMGISKNAISDEH